MLISARPYVDVGMKMLDSNHWESQYHLSMKLYDLSAKLYCFKGDSNALHNCLMEIIANVKSFEDSLSSSLLLSKHLASQSKLKDAMDNCFSVLSALGEEFPQDVSLSMVINELSVIQATLANISIQNIKILAPMVDKNKIHAMSFMAMLCSYCIQTKPMMVPFISCRMVRLTIECGFCEESSIIGLVTVGYSLVGIKTYYPIMAFVVTLETHSFDFDPRSVFLHR